MCRQLSNTQDLVAYLIVIFGFISWEHARQEDFEGD